MSSKRDTPAQILLTMNSILRSHTDVLKTNKESDHGLEMIGTFPVQQGKQNVPGHYFASTSLKPKDVRLYFFPIYTHPEAFKLSEALQKMLKGKSCFHINQLDDELTKELKQMIAQGVRLYKKDGLI